MSQKPTKSGKPGRIALSWALWPLAIVALVASFVISFAAGANVMTAAFYAVMSVAAVFVVLTIVKTHYSESLDSMLYARTKLTLEERRKKAHAEHEAMRDELLIIQQRENQQDFFTKVLIVFVFTGIYSKIMYEVFHLYPMEAMNVSALGFVVFWIVAFRFLPKAIIVLFLFALAGMSAAVMASGPQVVLQIISFIIPTLFLMPLNFLIMFGPLTIINLRQMKETKPGESETGVVFDDVRGQDDAVRKVIQALSLFMEEGESQLLVLKGLLLEGGPGTGKTHLAKAIANFLNAAVIQTTAAAFISTFMGIGIIIVLWLFFRAESLAKRYRRTVIILDECEQVFRRRSGLQTGRSIGSAVSPYDVMEHDAFGLVGDVVEDSEASRQRAWEVKYPAWAAKKHQETHPIMGGMGMGMGGAEMTMPVWLDKLDGMPSAPWTQRLWRSTANWMLDILFVPPYLPLGRFGLTRFFRWNLPDKLRLRIPRPKPSKTRVLIIGLTNMVEVMDEALRRPGRLWPTIHFSLPDEEARYQIIDLYVGKASQEIDKSIQTPEKMRELAQATSGYSPAEIMMGIYGALPMRKNIVARLKMLAAEEQSGEELEPTDQRFLDGHKEAMSKPGWDVLIADWEALNESVMNMRFGDAKPGLTSEKHREVTAYHEVAGHLLPLAGFTEGQIATHLSIMPYGQARGFVSHRQLEEHDPQPQKYWEAQLRVGLGSIIAERSLYGDNGPGVSSDVANATKVAEFMANRWAMNPRKCKNEEEQKLFAKYGNIVLAKAGAIDPMTGMVNPAMVGGKEEEVCVFLGQALVDDYRLLKKNSDLVVPIVKRLLEIDVVQGYELSEIWADLVQNVERLTDADTDWPDELFDRPSPFYASTKEEK